MDTSRQHESVPANTTNTQILSGIEALLFVLVGVIAVRLPVPALVPVLVVIVGLLLLIRWMNAAPSRTREASAYLWHRYEQREVLLTDVQDIVGYITGERWHYRDLVSGVDWWFDENLVPDWRDVERDARRRSNGSGIRIRRSWRSRLNSLRYRVMRWLEGTMTRRSQLLDAV